MTIKELWHYFELGLVVVTSFGAIACGVIILTYYCITCPTVLAVTAIICFICLCVWVGYIMD